MVAWRMLHAIMIALPCDKGNHAQAHFTFISMCRPCSTVVEDAKVFCSEIRAVRNRKGGCFFDLVGANIPVSIPRGAREEKI